MNANNSVIKESLSTIGLSESEIDTYLALLERGEATISTIAEDADVTQQAMYSISDRLEDRGLVRVNDHASPKTIRALPPDEAITNLTSQVESITPLLNERFNETEPQTPEIQMVQSKETVLRRLKSAISEAQHEAIVSVPESVYPEIKSELEGAVNREALVLLLLGNVDSIEGVEDQFDGIADVVHAWDENVPFQYVIDDRLAMAGSAEVFSGSHADGDAVEVSRSRLTGTVLGTYLGTYWPASTELFVTDPYELPRTFDWFRQAALHARLHEMNEVKLWAEVETTEGGVISGTVSQVRQGMIEPPTNEFFVETSLVIETDDGRVTVGGPGSFIEDFEAHSVTLRKGD
jgi:sugar-specific transcriptional regulator TrmB